MSPAIVLFALCAAQTVLIAGLVVQLSRRRRVERALRTSEAALSASCEEAKHLAGRLIAAQESERHRVARDLHDNLSQKLAVLCIDIGNLRTRASASPGTVAESVTHLLERAQDIAGSVRCLAHDLHATKLELVGLAPALEGLCRDVSRQGSVRVEFRQGVVGQAVPTDAALCLFRIAQEALQNILKHSAATAATVRLAQTGQTLRLHIADDGKGFDRTLGDRSGLGLLSMRERVRFVGGRIRIRTSAGRGTRIVVTLPVSNEPLISSSSAPLHGVRADLPYRAVVGVISPIRTVMTG